MQLHLELAREQHGMDLSSMPKNAQFTPGTSSPQRQGDVTGRHQGKRKKSKIGETAKNLQREERKKAKRLVGTPNSSNLIPK